MQRWLLSSQELSLSLSSEFKLLSSASQLAAKSSVKISYFLAMKSMSKGWQLFWYFLEAPSLWEKIGPDKAIRKNRKNYLDEVRPFIHPPRF